tara:strand:+ start:540 stop:1436 length:897 start_codon:yes stop_codon:yes gene_type:complete
MSAVNNNETIENVEINNDENVEINNDDNEEISSSHNEIDNVDNIDNTLHLNHNSNIDWFNQTEYIVFSNELKSLQRNNVIILKECKDNKRLLDLKYDDLNTIVNNIQTSVIFFSTFSGFIQATRIQLTIPDTVSSIFSITVATYISLILSISKYYKLDEIKEKIQLLREKYSLLHNKLDHRMDIIGPWGAKNLWIHQDPVQKFKEWKAVCKELDEGYEDIIKDKQSLVTEFEIIMDTKSRNTYFIKNREFNYANRELLYAWDKKETELEKRIAKEQVSRRPSSIKLQHEELDNWTDEV